MNIFSINEVKVFQEVIYCGSHVFGAFDGNVIPPISSDYDLLPAGIKSKYDKGTQQRASLS